MTVANSRPTSSEYDSPSRRDDSPRRSPRGATSPSSSNPKPKPPLDVVDLLLMSAFESNTVTLPRPAAGTEAAAGDLLDAIVADHLTRAAEPSAAPDAALTPDPVSPSSLDTDNAGLLQQEIDALLADSPASDTPSLSTDAAPLSTHELDTLLAAGPTSDADAPPATMPGNLLADEGESKLLEAEAALANELEGMQSEASPDPAPTIVASEPAPDITPDSPAAAPPAAVPAHPIVELLPASTLTSSNLPVRLKPTRFAGLFADIALVAAQIADMPFRWIDVMDKNLLGVAALIMLLSGLALKFAAWWMGVH